ncbi:conserved hypothetical protein [Ricinus communis]|uniref:Uncharacterized protein n=1 Tax=Ricinus communis TaxID=3988 RepID=B9REK6_RICCO|nr:conserved hypothetical protein [Ricinus communis]
MSEIIKDVMQPLLKRIKKSSWALLEPPLASLRYLRDVSLDFPFLNVAVSFWDSNAHVFWFGTSEAYSGPFGGLFAS